MLQLLHLVVRVLIWLFPVSEVALLVFRRSWGLGASSRDRGSMALIWGVTGAGLVGAILLAPLQAAPLPWRAPVRDGLAAVAMAGGMVLRWSAIRTLGRFFTVDVAIHADHRVVHTGPYAWVRHPSYSGLLLLWLGVAINFRSGLCMVVLLAPVALVLAWRIRTEEAALRKALGAHYEDYCRTTKRLVPGII